VRQPSRIGTRHVWRILNIARGRYWSELGNTPGHLQHWSASAFTALLAQRFEAAIIGGALLYGEPSVERLVPAAGRRQRDCVGLVPPRCLRPDPDR
jgi:hypothetical protein